jgi:predicted nucleotidyltransferase
MDLLDEELISFWRRLNSCHLKYIMIGGLAVRFHGYNRATDDLDMWIQDVPENRKRLRLAFSELGYGDMPEIETMQIIPGWTSFHAAGIVLDLFTEMPGLEHLTFDECFDQASIANIEGVEVRFLHLNHLLLNKQKLNRPKDQLDIIYLSRIKKLKDSFHHPDH